MFTNYFRQLYTKFIQLTQVYLIGIILFFIARLIFLFVFGDFNELTEYKRDILKAFFTGFRFDTLVICYALILPTLLSFFIGTPSVKKSLNKSILLTIFGVFFIITFLVVADFFYFQFFKSHYNILVFGLLYDDTQTIIRSMWTDFPVIKILIILLIIPLVIYFFLRKIYRKTYHFPVQNIFAKIFFVFLFLGVYFLGVRGSIGMFPLGKDHVIISNNNFINTLANNAIFSLKEAFADKMFYKINTDIEPMLKRYKWSSIEEAIGVYTGRKNKNEDISKQLIESTPKNSFIEKNPPNVIFIMMESMSNYYLDFHSERMNLLGRLEQEENNCVLFRNFLPSSNGTIASLERLLINTPQGPISQSEYFSHSFSSSVAKPYWDKNYNTLFATSAKLGWRNIGSFLSAQYYNFTLGESYIQKYYSETESNEWGVYDEYLFKSIYDRLSLSAKENKPFFCFAMTTTNHTPFSLPSTYKPYQIEIPRHLMKKIIKDEEHAQKAFSNYQYSNDCLGKFIEKIRKSKLGENTIIAATGDHNSLHLFHFTDPQILQKRSVPFILYVPEKYKPVAEINNKRFGGHNDIFPTLFHLSLSEAHYLKSGNNLFDNSIDENNLFAVNDYNLAMNNIGGVYLHNKPIFFRWKDSTKKYTIPTNSKETPELIELEKKLRAFCTSMTYYIQNDILKGK